MAVPLVTGEAADERQMYRVQGELLAVLRKYQETTDLGLLIVATVRCAGILLGQFTGSTKTMLRAACCAFLNERHLADSDPASRLFRFH